jgi:hypothetical protein
MHQPTAPIRSCFTSFRLCSQVTAEVKSRALILWKSAGELVGQVGVGGHLATIEVDGQRYIAFGGIARSLLFDPVVQAPPLMNENQGRMGSGA